jgi:Rieske 2Fe-2S family protein
VKHPRIVEIVRSAVAAAHLPEVPLADGAGTVPVAHYMDGDRLVAERTRLFRSMPIPIAHVSEIKNSDHNVLVRDLDGVSLVLTSSHPDGGGGGAIRGFRNSCRHRGVRLLREDCKAKALVCPYHGWTYGTDGALIHIPHPQAFPTCDRARQGLVPVSIEERHGIIWASLEEGAPNVASHLGGALDDEIASHGFDSHVVGARVVTEQRGNWKMLMEAFLEGYHIRQLHRNSVYPFFLDSRSVAEREGLHVRAASARRAAKEIRPEQLADHLAKGTSLRDIATVSYVLFPSTTLIMHPDWTSLVVVQPLATDRFVWSHTQLIPEEPKTDEAKAHFARSFALIEGNVFQKEDLLMCAEMQSGLETGANTMLTFGLLESPALWLHEGIASSLSSY